MIAICQPFSFGCDCASYVVADVTSEKDAIESPQKFIGQAQVHFIYLGSDTPAMGLSASRHILEARSRELLSLRTFDK